MKFKKGQWIVTPFNKYPFKLGQDGRFGVFIEFFTGNRFLKANKQEAILFEKPLVYCVRDSRNGIMQSEGWIESSKVRLATKKDVWLLVEMAKKRVGLGKAELDFYIKVMESL